MSVYSSKALKHAKHIQNKSACAQPTHLSSLMSLQGCFRQLRRQQIQLLQSSGLHSSCGAYAPIAASTEPPVHPALPHTSDLPLNTGRSPDHVPYYVAHIRSTRLTSRVSPMFHGMTTELCSAPSIRSHRSHVTCRQAKVGNTGYWMGSSAPGQGHRLQAL